MRGPGGHGQSPGMLQWQWFMFQDQICRVGYDDEGIGLKLCLGEELVLLYLTYILVGVHHSIEILILADVMCAGAVHALEDAEGREDEEVLMRN